MGINVDQMSNTFKSLGHPIRLEIILLLSDANGYQYGELAGQLRIESSGKLSFHLNKLQELVLKDSDGVYQLNDKGKQIVEALESLGLQSSDQPRPDIQKSETKKEGGLVSQVFTELTPAKFLVIGVILNIIGLPFFYIGYLLFGAIAYRLSEQYGNLIVKDRFN